MKVLYIFNSPFFSKTTSQKNEKKKEKSTKSKRWREKAAVRIKYEIPVKYMRFLIFAKRVVFTSGSTERTVWGFVEFHITFESHALQIR